MTATDTRLRSTGRTPALSLEGVRQLLSAYYETKEDGRPMGVEDLAARFEVTPATVRKYLKLALGSLPRGKAMLLPREPKSVQRLVNRIPTEEVLGAGQVELLHRQHEAGDSVKVLAERFGLSERRVRKLVRGEAKAA